MPRDSNRSDEGAALIMVLALLTVLSIALGAIFGNAGANLATSTLVSDQGKTFYAADGEVEFLIQKIRMDDTVCNGGPLPQTLINGRTANVSCSPQPSPPDTFAITANVGTSGSYGTTSALVTIGPLPDRRVIIRSWVVVRP